MEKRAKNEIGRVGGGIELVRDEISSLMKSEGGGCCQVKRAMKTMGLSSDGFAYQISRPDPMGSYKLREVVDG